MHECAIEESDTETFRDRLGRMSNPELLRLGVATKYMCLQETALGHPPRQALATQLKETREEWKRRNPSLPLSVSF